MKEDPISFDSKERVAYDFMKMIASQEKINEQARQNIHDRKYYLKLFAQCLRAVKGVSTDEVLNE